MSDRTGDDWRRSLRVGVAIATLLAGLVVLSSGAARVGADGLRAIGLPSADATVVAAAGAALVPIAILLVVLLSAGVERRYLRYAGVGGALAVVGVGVAMQSSTPFTDPVAVGTYALGALLAVGALVGGAVDDSTPSKAARSTPGYTARRSTDRITPADGGEEEDDDLEFLIEDE